MASQDDSSYPWPFPRLLASHIDGTDRSVNHRQLQFRRLNEALVQKKDSVLEALTFDFGFSDFEAVFEYFLIMKELRIHYDSVSLPQELAASKAIERGKQHASRSVGTGIVYIIPEIGAFSIISPLCAVIAAGACTVIEIPQTSRRTSAVLRDLLIGAMSSDTFAISTARPDERFLSKCTIVAQSSSDPQPSCQKLLSSPSTSRNFVFVDRSADARLAARHTIDSRFRFNGASSYAPDIVFVHEAVMGMFLAHLVPAAGSTIGTLNGKSKIRDSREKRSLVSLSEMEDVTLLFSSPRGAIIQTNDAILPKVLQSPQVSDSPIPILIICSITSPDVAIDMVAQSGPLSSASPSPTQNPSAAFIFADNTDAQYLSNSVDAEITCINTIPSQLMVGPRFPKLSGQSFVQGLPETRYTRDMFEEHRFVSLGKESSTKLPENAISLARSKAGQDKILAEFQTMLSPLKKKGREPKGFIDIFDTGLMLSAGIAALSVTTGFVFLGRYAFRYMSSTKFGFSN